MILTKIQLTGLSDLNLVLEKRDTSCNKEREVLLFSRKRRLFSKQKEWEKKFGVKIANFRSGAGRLVVYLEEAPFKYEVQIFSTPYSYPAVHLFSSFVQVITLLENIFRCKED